jgi:hypothetical protein
MSLHIFPDSDKTVQKGVEMSVRIRTNYGLKNWRDRQGSFAAFVAQSA